MEGRGEGNKGRNNPKADLALHGLYWVHHHGHRARVQLFKALRSVDIHIGEPTPKARVGVVPAHHDLCTPHLLEPVHHFLLEYRVHCLHTDTCSTLGHGEHVAHRHCIVVHNLPQHQPHHLKGDSGAACARGVVATWHTSADTHT